MANEGMGRDRDLVLPPGTFAYVLDSTKGKVSVYVGPYKNSLSNTDQLVVWDAESRRFHSVNDVERATQVFPMAPEGYYIVLSNPVPGTDGGKQHPPEGNSTETVRLDLGRKVNVPGPVTFPLWPGQTALTIAGHDLRYNQYLVVRVYDEAKARQNWQSAVVKPQMPLSAAVPVEGEVAGAASAAEMVTSTMTDEAPLLTMGKLMVVKGTEVSFYIPPTGIEVVPEQQGRFVREAVTLERLEYCILLDESGDKRYVQGPAVVFPKPTEKFVESGDGMRKYRAIELNTQSGLYIKVIADYTEGDQEYHVGDELFITGKEQSIYFPRQEHSIVQYGSRQKHHAVAIPTGEGRYSLNRDSGMVDLVRGPIMFLPDPRTQVVVRRILSPRQVRLFYPGNAEALEVNRRYQDMSAELAPGEFLAAAELESLGTVRSARGASRQIGGETFERGTTYTPPRTIVLDTKYEGAVGVNVWPGYAILVTDKSGDRRVELGPKAVLLEYDETLMPLELSTGKPKSDANRLSTVYLQVTNNQVSDRVIVETSDLVEVSVTVSYRVNFEGETAEEREHWFDVEDYVKVLTDHGRSRMRNAVKHHGIQAFYAGPIDIVRDAILGKVPVDGPRPGLRFPENGMRVFDVEVLDVSIDEPRVAAMLLGAQETAIKGAVELAATEERVARTKRSEELKRDEIAEQELTARDAAKRDRAAIDRIKRRDLAHARANLELEQQRNILALEAMELERKEKEQEIDLARLAAQQQIEFLRDQTAEYVKRAGAVTPDMVTALQMFGDKQYVARVAEAVGPVALATGVTTADILKQVFEGTPLESLIGAFAERPMKVGTGNSR